jgi:hypothetical protein
MHLSLVKRSYEERGRAGVLRGGEAAVHWRVDR